MDNNSYDKGSMVFALDIGTRSVIGILGSYKDKKIVIHHSAIEFHQSRVMFDGQIHDIEEVASIVKKVKEQLEEKAGITLKEVAIAAAGRALKTHRVEIEKELDENKSALNSVQTELEKKQKELEVKEKISELPDKPLSGKIKLVEEIDKNLDVTDGDLKTKKIGELDTEDV